MSASNSYSCPANADACDDTRPDDLPLDLRLAAIIHLLSSTALRGTTANKTACLQAHLVAAVQDGDALGPALQDAVESALAHWQDVQCHANSNPVDAPPVHVAPPALQ